MDLKDKVVIITGGGRGIGAATAELCAQNGAKVVIADINDEWGQKVLGNIKGQGLEISYLHADVSKEADVAALVKFAVDKYGKLDGIFNNAATIVVKPVADLTFEEWNKVISVNLTGVFLGCKHAIQQFLPFAMDRPMGQVRMLDERMNEAGYLRLMTADPLAQNMSNQVPAYLGGKPVSPSLEKSTFQKRLLNFKPVRQILLGMYDRIFKAYYQ